MNCFQIVFLLWSLTTLPNYTGALVLLWIAFKLYFYCGLWQQCSCFILWKFSCELLSNCIFTVVFDNSAGYGRSYTKVVNCFQIVFLLWSLTTQSPYWEAGWMLWIAFKLYFYCGLWQRVCKIPKILNCCELLSNCIFTVVFDNSIALRPALSPVVNCFQIVFLLWSLTTTTGVSDQQA